MRGSEKVLRRIREDPPLQWRGFGEDFEEVSRRLRGDLPGEVLRRYCGGYEEVTRRPPGEVLRRLRGGYEEVTRRPPLRGFGGGF